jgi:hypothetical protein
MIDLFIVPEEGKVVYDFHLGNWPEEKKRFSLWESDSVALADRLVQLSHDPRKIIQMFLARKDIRRTHYASGRLGTRKPPRWWSAGFTLSAKEFKLDRNTLSREISLLITIMASIGRRCRASIAHFSALLLSRGSLSVFFIMLRWNRKNTTKKTRNLCALETIAGRKLSAELLSAGLSPQVPRQVAGLSPQVAGFTSSDSFKLFFIARAAEAEINFFSLASKIGNRFSGFDSSYQRTREVLLPSYKMMLLYLFFFLLEAKAKRRE